MIREILQRVRCPHCGSPGEEAAEGVVCQQGHLIPRRTGYLDAMVGSPDPDTVRTLESFGYEWTTFDQINPEDEAFWEIYMRDVPLGELGDLVGLDAGCGKGRFTRLTAPYLKALVALDGSAAVEAAVANLSGLDNVEIVRADLRQPPFADGSFGFVCSLGVLHHLPDPEAGFRRLVRLLAPGGLILLYLYSRPERNGARSLGLAATARLRRVTRRLPHQVLRPISGVLAAGLYASVVLPGEIGRRREIPRLSSLPLQAYRGRPLRSLWLDTFDRLSAPVEHRYVWAELRGWFERADVEVEAVREDAGYFILGRRPGERSPQ